MGYSRLRKAVVVPGIVVMLGLAGSAAARAGETPDPFDLHISIGRMAVMVEQGETALGLAASPMEKPDPDRAAEDPDRLYADLYDTVLAYNQLQAEACARQAVGADLCDKPFFPRWLKLPGRQHANLDDLRRWIDQTQSHVAPLTGALCDRAIKNGAETTLCAIE